MNFQKFLMNKFRKEVKNDFGPTICHTLGTMKVFLKNPKKSLLMTFQCLPSATISTKYDKEI